MKRTFILFLLFLFPLSFLGCGIPSNADNSSSSSDTLYKPKYASRFLLLKKGDSIILNVNDPWQGAKETLKSYCITNPYERIIAMSTSHLAYLEAIGKEKDVIGVSGKNYIYSPSYKETQDVGYDSHLEFEKIIGMRPDVMFVYEVAGENSSIFNKLTSLGVNIVYIADYLETSPLGRAEWIIAFGAMTGSLEESIEYFNKVESNYNQIKNSSVKSTKKVILNSPYQDVWYFPSDESYPVKLIEDAGGNYAGEEFKGTGSVPVSMETAYRIIKSSNIWLNPSIGTTSKKMLLENNPILKDIDIPLFGNDKRSTNYGGIDYYELGVVRPDLILKDLKEIISDTEGVQEDSLFFYRQIF